MIVAEAVAALGRPTEARRLANRAAELIGGPLDPYFAGMPHSDVWPVQPAERSAVVGAGAAAAGVTDEARSSAGDPGPATGAGPAASTRDLPGSVSAAAVLDPGAELAAARAAIAAGDRDGAAIRLAVVLRLTPALAPAVLDIVGAESGPGFDLVRGDALRLVGRESQARRSYAAARGSVPAEPTPVVSSPLPDPGTEADSGGAVDPLPVGESDPEP